MQWTSLSSVIEFVDGGPRRGMPKDGALKASSEGNALENRMRFPMKHVTHVAVNVIVYTHVHIDFKKPSHGGGGGGSQRAAPCRTSRLDR